MDNKQFKIVLNNQTVYQMLSFMASYHRDVLSPKGIFDIATKKVHLSLCILY